MSALYRALYEYCQKLPSPINRNSIRDKVVEISGRPSFRIFVDQLNEDFVYGYYLSAKNTQHRFVQQAGGHTVIVFARGLNRCWQRFVTVKEMMHIFDDPLQSTNSGPELEALLGDFWSTSAAPKGSPQMTSEVKCFWMAVGILCPEPLRVDLQQKRASGSISDIEIATQLKIPEKYVSRFFNDGYKQIINWLISD